MDFKFKFKNISHILQINLDFRELLFTYSENTSENEKPLFYFHFSLTPEHLDLTQYIDFNKIFMTILNNDPKYKLTSLINNENTVNIYSEIENRMKLILNFIDNIRLISYKFRKLQKDSHLVNEEEVYLIRTYLEKISFLKEKIIISVFLTSYFDIISFKLKTMGYIENIFENELVEYIQVAFNEYYLNYSRLKFPLLSSDLPTKFSKISNYFMLNTKPFTKQNITEIQYGKFLLDEFYEELNNYFSNFKFDEIFMLQLKKVFMKAYLSIKREIINSNIKGKNFYTHKEIDISDKLIKEIAFHLLKSGGYYVLKDLERLGDVAVVLQNIICGIFPELNILSNKIQADYRFGIEGSNETKKNI